MKHPMKKRMNRLERKVAELKRALSEVRSTEIRDFTQEKEKFPGFWVIELGQDRHFRGEVLACAIKIHIDQLEFDLYSREKQPLALRSLVRQHCLNLVKILENGIVDYMESHKVHTRY